MAVGEEGVGEEGVGGGRWGGWEGSSGFQRWQPGIFQYKTGQDMETHTHSSIYSMYSIQGQENGVKLKPERRQGGAD